MRWLGCALLLTGALLGGLVWCRQGRRQAALGRALERQLTLLRREVCVCRRPLAEIAGTLAAEEGETELFWQTLAAAIAEEGSFFRCWQRALAILPSVYRDILAPLAVALPLGGEEAASLLDQAVEDLRRCLRREQEGRQEREKLAVALAVSAGTMAALALL